MEVSKPIVVTTNDILYECGTVYPEVCPVCKGRIDLSKKLLINHLVKSYRCLGCERLFVTYRDWMYIPSRESYTVEHNEIASAIREDEYADRRIKKKLHRVQNQAKKLRREAESNSDKKQRQKAKEERAYLQAIKERNGDPLGKLPKQRKRSFYS